MNWQNGELILQIKLQPKASFDAITGIIDDRIKIRLTSPPIDNKANQHLVQYLAKQFSIAKSNIEIIKGLQSRLKTLRIRSLEELPNCLVFEH